MNERLSIACTAVIVVAVVLAGCRTTGGADQSVIEHSQQLAELEAGIRSYGRTVESVVTDIAAVRERAEGIGDTIEQTIILFDCYQRSVERLLQDYSSLRGEVEDAEDDTDNHVVGVGT